MTIQQIVTPDRIEPELLKIWEALAKENTTRASLFNLIVYTRLNARADYFRTIVQKVVEKFPCRTLFISHDHQGEQNYLKTAVSVLFPIKEESSIACDQIDLGVSGRDLERVPFVILPHLIPDLPVYLLWAEDPSQPHPLFTPLLELATRIIFDSESADSLPSFAQTVLSLKQEKGIDVADLNWARTEGWRDLIASLFDTPERIRDLNRIRRIQLTYNERSTEFFCHLKVQALYILSWLTSRLQWKPTGKAPSLQLTFSSDSCAIEASIDSAKWKELGPGALIKAEMETIENHLFEMSRLSTQPTRVKIQIATLEKCELPYQFTLGPTATGQSLVKEICTRGTSQHYLGTLHQLLSLSPIMSSP